MSPARPQRILIVTGMSGAGKSTALRTFEDLGWEVVDNLPLALLETLLRTPLAPGTGEDARPLALGVDSRTRGFDARRILGAVAALRAGHEEDVEILFVDCEARELGRRFSETRRRHPLALDRPAAIGIEREREALARLRTEADHVVDTTALTSQALQDELRRTFGTSEDGGQPTLGVTSFGFSRGLPRNADLVFDMRFLRNPYWDRALRPGTGRDPGVVAYIADDPAYAGALSRIEELLIFLLPHYESAGRAYVTIAFGCTGGRHRSVHVAERVAKRLRDAGFSPTIAHRDLPPPA
jgi:UPF0042 nucleotide-binding protein